MRGVPWREVDELLGAVVDRVVTRETVGVERAARRRVELIHRTAALLVERYGSRFDRDILSAVFRRAAVLCGTHQQGGRHRAVQA
jgi:hypothetical protein